MSRGLPATVPRRRGEGTGWERDAEGVCKAIPLFWLVLGIVECLQAGACVCGVWAGAAAMGWWQEVAGQRHGKSQSTAPKDSVCEHFSKRVMLKGCTEPSALAAQGSWPHGSEPPCLAARISRNATSCRTVVAVKGITFGLGKKSLNIMNWQERLL